MIKEKAIAILDSLVEKGKELAIEMEKDQYDTKGTLSAKGSGYNTECLEAIKKVVGEDSEYFKNFLGTTSGRFGVNHLSILRGLELLKSLKNTINDGLVDDIKTIAKREVFGEIADAANEMLQSGYKALAANQIGISLEQRIRELCKKHGVITETGTPPKHIAADTLNAELVKAGVYGVNMQKQITAWLGIRNSAAHGKDGEYNEGQVGGMIEGIRSFLDAYPA